MNIHAGSTSYTLPIWIADTSSTTGGGLGSLTSATSGLVAEYRREGQSSWTAITLSAGTLGTWSSGGFVADGSDTGAYELGLPNAATASLAGVRWVAVRLRGATNMLTTRWRVALDQVDYQDAVRFGLTGIPNAAAGANGGLPTGDASGRVLLQPTQTGVTIPTVTTVATVTTLTNAPSDSTGTGTLLGRLTSTRAGYLDNLSTAPPTVVQIRTEMDSNSTKLANLDATISSRSTFAGGAVASVTGAVGSIATGGITAASIASSALTAAKFATDSLTAAALASDAVAEIAAVASSGGGASADEVVAAMTTANFAKKTDVNVEVIWPGQS